MIYGLDPQVHHLVGSRQFAAPSCSGHAEGGADGGGEAAEQNLGTLIDPR